MIDNKGKCRCDAEIGSVKNGWRTCFKPAIIQSRSEAGSSLPGIYLDWCAAHQNRATQEGRTIVKYYTTTTTPEQ